VRFRVARGVLPAGTYHGTVTIQPDGATASTVGVIANVGAYGPVTITPPSLSLRPTLGDEVSAFVTVDHPGLATPTAIPGRSLPWFAIRNSPLGVGKTRFDFAVLRSAPTGKYTFDIVFSTGGSSATLPVTIEIGGANTLTVSPSTLSLSAAKGGATRAQVEVIFSPSEAINATVKEGGSWLAVRRLNSSQQAALFEVTADAANLSPANYAGAVLFSAGGLQRTVDVLFTVEPSSTGSAPSAWPASVEFLTLRDGLAPWLVELSNVPSNPQSTTPPGVAVRGVGSRLEVSAPGPITCSSAASLLVGSLTIPVTCQSGGIVQQVLPQIADGGGFKTRIVLMNPHDSPARTTLSFVRGPGLPWQPSLAGSPSTQFDIPAWGMREFETTGEPGEAVSGYSVVDSSQRLQGFALYRQASSSGIVQEATVPLAGERANRFFLPFDHTSGLQFGLAMANVCNAPARFEARLIDESGAASAPAPLSEISANSHRADLLSGWIPGSLNRRGTLEVLSRGGCITPLGLRFTPQGAFTSLMPHSAPVISRSIVFPQIADGGGFTTAISLTNHSPESTQVQLRFRRNLPGNQTAPWTALSQEIYSIPPLSTLSVVTPGGPGAAVSGYAEAVPLNNTRIAGQAVFRLAGPEGIQEAAVPGASNAVRRTMLPFDHRDGHVTALALANPSSNAAEALFHFRDPEGRTLLRQTLSLPAGGHMAIELPSYFDGTGGLNGTVEISSPGGVFLLPLRFTPQGVFTSLSADPL